MIYPLPGLESLVGLSVVVSDLNVLDGVFLEELILAVGWKMLGVLEGDGLRGMVLLDRQGGLVYYKRVD